MSQITAAKESGFSMDQYLATGFRKLLYNGLICQLIYFVALFFVLLQEQYLLTTLNGYFHIHNAVRTFPFVFMVLYEFPEFFEQFFTNKKMASYVNGQNIQDINRKEFATNFIFAVLMIAIPAAQPVIFSTLKVDSEYKSMFLLSTTLGLIEPFKSTVYSVFSLKQNYLYILVGKMTTLIIHFFLYSYIYSFQSRNSGDIDTWASGFSKPFADIVIHVILLITLFRGSIFSTRIALDADQTSKISLIPRKGDWRETGKNLLAFLQYLVFFVSRPVVYVFVAYKINNLKNEAKKQTATLDLFVYMICQQVFSLIAKGANSAIMTVMPLAFHQKQYTKMRLLISYGCLLLCVFLELLALVLVMKSEIIFTLMINKDADSILLNYFTNGQYKTLLKRTAFLFGTDVYQHATNTFAYITGRHYIPMLIGILRIVGGVYFIINVDNALGQNASYTDVFFYFELLCTVLAVIFCTQSFISMFADYKNGNKKNADKNEKQKEKDKKAEEFMVQ
ncbi:Hypothetical_protein [Hexamita inflata]|uniref:Hypothetical_protein n=1 Tax=Hexamita inflata TaxID=28002 RepID=A0ABP1HA21_9EUKA